MLDGVVRHRCRDNGGGRDNREQLEEVPVELLDADRALQPIEQRHVPEVDAVGDRPAEHEHLRAEHGVQPSVATDDERKHQEERRGAEQVVLGHPLPVGPDLDGARIPDRERREPVTHRGHGPACPRSLRPCAQRGTQPR